MTRSYPHLSVVKPALYRILVQGWLPDGWEDWFEGMLLTRMGSARDSNDSRTCEKIPDEASLLSGVVPDQAALLGMLQRLYAFGLPILKVEFVSQDEDGFVSLTN
jgi:hypothetical protein